MLQPSMQPLYGYGGAQLVVRGKYNMKCQYRDIQFMLKCYVVDTHALPVLGLQACLDFGLIELILSVSAEQEVSVMEEFAEEFLKG